MVERGFWFRTAVVVVSLSAIVFLFSALGRVWGFLGDLLLIFFLAYLAGSLVLHIVNDVMRVPHMTRPLAILLVYAAFIMLVAIFGLLVIPSLVAQVTELAELVPGYVDRAPELTQWAEDSLARAGIQYDLHDRIPLEDLSNLAATAAGAVAENALGILQRVVSLVFAVSLIVVISFYIVLDGGRRLHEALKVLPPRAEQEARFVLRTIDDTFYGYLRGMLLVSMIYGVGTAGVMIGTGLPAALPVALVSSILLAVPFVGDWLALALPLIVAAVAGDFITFIIVLGVLLFVQQVMLNLLTPRILGSAVRMPAMLVIIAVVVGARLAGLAGALLGVPTMGVIHALAVHYGMRIRVRREERENATREAAEPAAVEAEAAEDAGNETAEEAEARLLVAGTSPSTNGEGEERARLRTQGPRARFEGGMPPC